MFTEADLTKALTDVGARLAQNITAYLIGGCAMTFMGRKVATKDIDIVLSSTGDARQFTGAMHSLGFSDVHQLTSPYTRLGAFAIVEDARKMRFDIFDRQVYRALELSKGMQSRARLYKRFGSLDVYLMSPEDIFLFKGITEREADLDDMRVLVEVGLNWRIIEGECLTQQQSGRWAYLLGTKLMDLRAKFGIESPITKTLMDRADLDLLTYVFREIIGDEERVFKEIAEMIREKYRYSASWTRQQLRILVQKGIVGTNKKDRRVVYFMKKFRIRQA